MRIGEAKLLVRQCSREARRAGQSSREAFRAIPAAQAIEAFEAFAARGDAELVHGDEALLAFLWETYLRFSDAHARESEEGRALAPRILQAFGVAAGEDHPRTLELKSHTFIHRIASSFGFKPGSGWPSTNPRDFEDEVSRVSSSSALPDELIDLVARAKRLFEGRDGANGDVISTLTFELPHPLTRRHTVLEIVHQGLSATIQISPTSHAMDMVRFEEEVDYARMMFDGGAWPPGVSQITVTADGVLDWTSSVEGYSTVSERDRRSNGIPFIAADIVRATTAALAERHPEELDGRWAPTATDVRGFNLTVGTIDTPGLFHSISMAPGGVQVVVLDGPTFASNLGEVSSPAPWDVARTYALGALRSARYFEAVVWANVSVEAYIDDRLEEIACMPEVDRESLFAATSVFAEAEEAVVASYPELAGKIEWPEREKAPSRFRQIAAAGRQAPLRGSKASLTKIYRQISAPRNDAVHGRTIDAVMPDQAANALASLDAFVDQFRLAAPGP